MENKAQIAHRCLLLENKAVTGDWFLLTLQAPLPLQARPGQFVQLRLGPGTDPLLRRPFSIHHEDSIAGRLRLLVRVAGAGTARVAAFVAGQEIDLLGPFGQGFPYPEEKAKALLVGGGIGMAPLYFLAAQRRREGLPFDFLIGGRSAASLPADAYFREHRLEPSLATEDGSRGFRGTVTALLEHRLLTGPQPGRIHACGPLPMLARVAEIGRARGIPTHVSLESRLACAVGACLGCAFPFHRDGAVEYRRVCRDGPVFNGEEVCFES